MTKFQLPLRSGGVIDKAILRNLVAPKIPLAVTDTYVLRTPEYTLTSFCSVAEIHFDVQFSSVAINHHQLLLTYSTAIRRERQTPLYISPVPRIKASARAQPLVVAHKPKSIWSFANLHPPQLTLP